MNTIRSSMLLSAALLLGAAALPGAEPQLRFSGVVGQSQALELEPFQNVGFDGCVADAPGSLWTASGKSLCHFVKRGGAWAFESSVELPARPQGIRWDGAAGFFIVDGKAWSFDPVSRKASLFSSAASLKGVAAFDVSPAQPGPGLAAKCKLLLLRKDGAVSAIARDGSDKGLLLQAPKLAGDCPYTGVCFDLEDGGLLLSSYYPDSKVSRYSESLEPQKGGAWPVSFFASHLINFGKEPWAISNGGAFKPLLGKKNAQLEIPYLHYVGGAARNADGSFSVACSQGLLEVSPEGEPLRRFGGIPSARCLAAGPGGELLVAIEDGQRLLRLSIADGPDGVPASSGNEPFRIGGGWKAKASAIVWDGARYLAADSVEGRLWAFDTTQMGYTQKPWTEVLPKGSLDKCSALAVAWPELVLADAKGLKRLNLRDPASGLKALEAPGLGAASSLAISPGNVLFVASDAGLSAWRLEASGLAPLWKSPLGALSDAKIAFCAGSFLVVLLPGSGDLLLLDAATGETLAKLDPASVPRGLKASAICSSGPWALVYDSKNFRVLRFKTEGRL